MNSLHRCRRGGGHRTASWHPTIDTGVRQYELEQRMLQDEKEDALRREEDALIESDIARLKKENARLAQINSMLERFEQEHLTCLARSLPPPPKTAVVNDKPPADCH
ncbi:MAG: hypothetical protein ACKOCI_00450 [Cyanobium sp.]